MNFFKRALKYCCQTEDYVRCILFIDIYICCLQLF